MNRQQEYEALLEELQQLPAQLSGTAERARIRRRGRRWGLSLGSLAGVCAAFVLAVNLMPSFALACAGVPILRELAAAVAFSPSLTVAVANDYAQPVGQSQTVDGVTVTVEYAVADAQQMVVFYRTGGGTGPHEVDCDLEDEAGNPLTGYSVSSYTAADDSGDDLLRFTIHFTELDVPDTLVLKLRLREEEGAWSREPYRFTIRLDPEKTAKARAIPVEQWVELDGQRLKVDRLELTPTRTALYLEENPDNTAWLQDLTFHFTGADGTVYESVDGIIGGVGQPEGGVYCYYFQSLYFTEEALTLWIDGGAWLQKDAGPVILDLADGTYTGTLPEGVTGLFVEEKEGQPVIWAESTLHRTPFSSVYRDEAGEERTFSGVSQLQSEDVRRFRYFPEEGTTGTVALLPVYTSLFHLEKPLSIPLG